ncbi:MAG: OmpA family protein [Candidatus Kapaibacterium sp.]
MMQKCIPVLRSLLCVVVPAALPVVACPNSAVAQSVVPERRISVGMSIGAVRPMNEAAYLNNQALSTSVNLFAVVRNGFTSGFSPELHISNTANESKDTSLFSSYRTGLWTADLRLRWHPWDGSSRFTPYVSAGMGIVIPQNEFPRNVTDPTFRKNTASLLFPVHVGAMIALAGNVSADIHAGWMFTTTDDINPAHDGRYDGWLRACAGLVYTIPPGIIDTDGDDLPDADERRIGTDPKRVDTDDDGLWDGAELLEYGTDPLNTDSDDGGVQDGSEVSRGTNPALVSDDILSIQAGETVLLRNIIFETGQTTFPASSIPVLESMATVMRTNAGAEILLVGHTDATGDRDANYTLSRERAQGVRDWLVAHGIDGRRIVCSGLGPDKPQSSNSSAEGRRRNRRIEVTRTK